MTDKPIIFSGPMVRAILEGRKTQTRRVLRNVPPRPEPKCHDRHAQKHETPYLDAYCGEQRTAANPRRMGPYWNWWQVDGRMCFPQFEVGYVPGDRLWVRETCSAVESHDGLDCVRYEADQVWRPIANTPEAGDRWCALFAYRNGRGLSVPSIHMPRWASRLTLIVEDVRVQRLQEISARDSIAEGVECQTCKAMLRSACGGKGCFASMVAFRNLWNSLNAKRGYDWETNPWVVALTFRPIQKNIDALNNEAAE